MRGTWPVDPPATPAPLLQPAADRPKTPDAQPLRGPRRELTGIPGSPPDLRSMPSGCAFHPRCPKKFEPCDSKVPVLGIPAGHVREGRTVACWLHPAGGAIDWSRVGKGGEEVTGYKLRVLLFRAMAGGSSPLLVKMPTAASGSWAGSTTCSTYRDTG